MPRGFSVNPNVAVVLPMMLHPDEATAIERGFGGAIGHDLGLADGTRCPWVLEVHGGRARAHQGASPDAALTISIRLTDSSGSSPPGPASTR